MQTTLDAASDFPALQGRVLGAARAIAGADGATFVLREADNCFYVDEDAIAPLWKGQRFPMTACISGWAMLNRESAVVADIEVDERIPLAAYRPTFVRSLAMVPIGVEAPMGAIGVYWASVRPVSPAVVADLEQFAAEVAIAVERIGLDNAPWAPNFRVSP
jgi:GAF domain-containing protein